MRGCLIQLERTVTGADRPTSSALVFEEHELRLSRQELSFLEKLKETIRGFGLRVVWEGEHQGVEALDVQLFEGEVCFRLPPIKSKLAR